MLTLANLAVNVVRMGAQLRIPYDKGIRCCYNYGIQATINTIIAPGWSLQKMLTLANLAVNVVRMGAQLRIPYDKGIRCCNNYKNGILW